MRVWIWIANAPCRLFVVLSGWRAFTAYGEAMLTQRESRRLAKMIGHPYRMRAEELKALRILLVEFALFAIPWWLFGFLFVLEY